MAEAVTAEIRVRRRTIDCEGCETTIERFLGREPGVQSVKASEQLQSVTVDWDPDATSLDEVKAKLADLGYPASSGWGSPL